MPWTNLDVDKHKSGLSPAEKEKWCKIANGFLKACQVKGGSDCEASAIRIANSRVGPTKDVESARKAVAKYMETYGGGGSGNFGHSGIPGHQGGSAADGGGGGKGDLPPTLRILRTRMEHNAKKYDSRLVPNEVKNFSWLLLLRNQPPGTREIYAEELLKGTLITKEEFDDVVAGERRMTKPIRNSEQPDELTTQGGEGSGNFDHAGIPGHQGGSAKDGGGGGKEEFKLTDKHWEGVTSALKKAEIPCRVKDLGDELVVELGWDFPDSLDRQVSSIIEKAGIPYGKYSLAAEHSGPSTKRSQTINGGPRRYQRSRDEEEYIDPSEYQQPDELETYSLLQDNTMMRTKMLEGRTHLVMSVVMMVEGVHNGSHGKLLHLSKDLGKFPGSWDGIPVMVGHPQKDGQNISANSPDVIQRSVGRVYNTQMVDGKLRAEVWIDELKIQSLSPDTLTQIRQGVPLEVSVGVFTDEQIETGDWKGEAYVAVAKNHRPDHLALLPGEKGACSWDDGCGIRLNQEAEVSEEVTKV